MEAFCADLRHPASQVCCRRSADGLLADGIHTARLGPQLEAPSRRNHDVS